MTAREIAGSMSMAPTGHTGTQLAQATQRSVEILTPEVYQHASPKTGGGVGVAPEDRLRQNLPSFPHPPSSRSANADREKIRSPAARRRPRRPAAGARRRLHDVHRRGRGNPEGVREAHRLADPDGDHP